MSTLSLALKDTVYNLGMELGSIPTKVEVGVKSKKKSKSSNSADAEREELLRSVREQIKKDQAKQSTKKKSAARMTAETKAAEEFIKNVKKDNNIQEVSDALKMREKKVEEQTSAVKLSKAEMTKKWLEYALYYMSTPGAQLLNLSKSQEGLVNGIAKYFSFGKIYENAKVSDIERFDKSFGDKYDEFSRYEISIIDDIVPLLENKEFMKKVEIRKQQLSSVVKEETKSETTKVVEDTTTAKAKPAPIEKEVKEETKVEVVKPEIKATEEVKTEGDSVIEEDTEIQEEAENNLDLSSKEDKDIREVIHPISFEVLKDEETTIKKEATKTSNNKLPVKLFKRLENIFVPLVGKKNHKYEMNGDLINLHVYKKDNTKESFIIDPGVYMGKGKIYILANMTNDKLPVSTEHKDILRKVLTDSSYILSANEAQKVLEDYFRNTNIYRYIDMNKTEFLNKISNEDFQKLGKKLTFIINQTPATDNGELPRLRFCNWESVEKFSIVSDSAVRSPFAETGETSSEIVEGLTYIIEGDNITQKIGDKINILQIQQYGDM